MVYARPRIILTTWRAFRQQRDNRTLSAAPAGDRITRRCRVSADALHALAFCQRQHGCTRSVSAFSTSSLPAGKGTCLSTCPPRLVLLQLLGYIYTSARPCEERASNIPPPRDGRRRPLYTIAKPHPYHGATTYLSDVWAIPSLNRFLLSWPRAPCHLSPGWDIPLC